MEGAESFPSLGEALAACEGTVWFLGGARIYEEAMEYADFLDMTTIPDRITPPAGAERGLFPRD